ncbi:MAG TPA: nucleotidyltransferase domain-containing protein [Clostridiales bacterium]|nr:nucleotidyltransferase domain-containing protein [Clostridiales bacterium]
MDNIEKCKNILIGYENIVFAYIFGSYAQRVIRTDSDIDIAIYLEKELAVENYLEIKVDLTEACKREIDLIILNDATPLLKYEIYKNSILLFSRDKAIETSYKVKTLFEYNDMKKYLDLYYDRTINRLKDEVKFYG